ERRGDGVRHPKPVRWLPSSPVLLIVLFGSPVLEPQFARARARGHRSGPCRRAGGRPQSGTPLVQGRRRRWNHRRTSRIRRSLLLIVPTCPARPSVFSARGALRLVAFDSEGSSLTGWLRFAIVGAILFLATPLQRRPDGPLMDLRSRGLHSLCECPLQRPLALFSHRSPGLPTLWPHPDTRALHHRPQAQRTVLHTSERRVVPAHSELDDHSHPRWRGPLALPLQPVNRLRQHPHHTVPLLPSQLHTRQCRLKVMLRHLP
ncbi:MAG: hypothetical protein ACI8RZ_001961, partial [Myxococcota bacterium]